MKDDLSQKNTWKYDIFCKCSEKLVFPKTNCTGTWSFLYYQEILNFFFQKIWSCSLEEKWKIVFFKQIHGNMIFSVYLVKMVFLFPTNMILPFCQKSKDDLLPKNTRKHDISGIIWKDDIHPWKCGVSSDKNIKDYKKVYSVKYA